MAVATPRPEIAVIGAGLMGRWHAATAHRLGARIVAIVDPDPARAQQLASRYGARALPDLGSLLQATRPAVAHVCTSGASHAATCEALLSAGCHVLCEKPLADTAETVSRLLQAADTAERRLCVVHQFASQRGVAEVRRRLPALMPLSLVSLCICTAGAHTLAEVERDSLVFDVLPHPLSVLRVWLPDASLAATSWHLVHARNGELLATAQVAGVPVSIHISCSSRPTEASAVARGTGGTAHLDFFHGYASFSAPAVSRGRKILQPLTRPASQLVAAAGNLARRVAIWEPAYPGLRELTRRFYLSIEGAGPSPMSSADILDVYRARDMLVSAMRALR